VSLNLPYSISFILGIPTVECLQAGFPVVSIYCKFFSHFVFVNHFRNVHWNRSWIEKVKLYEIRNYSTRTCRPLCMRITTNSSQLLIPSERSRLLCIFCFFMFSLSFYLVTESMEISPAHGMDVSTGAVRSLSVSLFLCTSFCFVQLITWLSLPIFKWTECLID